MKKLCVFCGSSPGKDSKYTEMAKRLGKSMVENKVDLVYGGASIGVMGAVANSVLEGGGEVVGVIPQSIIDLEVGHQHLTNLEIVDSMHERKERMYDLSDGFLAIAGGMGTLDELCEIATWAQLKYHNKPIYVANDFGFFDNLMSHLRYINKEGFLSDEHLALVREFPTYESALEDFLSPED